MKASEFKKLIREEVRRALKEATPKFKVGDSVVVDNLEDYPFKVKAIFPNKAKMLKDVQNMTTPAKFKKLVQYLKDSEDDNWDIDDPDGSPWVYVVATGTSSEDRRYNEFPFVVPSEIVWPEDMDEGFRKGLKEVGGKVTKAELKTMKGTVGWIANEDTAYDIPDFWPSYIVSDIQVVSFDEGAKEVLEYAKDYGAGSEQIKEMAAKLKELKTMGNKFVLYGFEADLNLGVL